MSTQQFQGETPNGCGNSGSTVRHSRDDVIDERTFERLVEATYGMDDPYGLQCRFVLFVAGRLGLRAGEIAHMTADWWDQRHMMLCIPRHEPCTDGRGGGVCAHCRSNIDQSATIEAEQSAGSVEPDPDYSAAWRPKTPAAARDVPYESNTRSSIVIEEFFNRFNEWPQSRQSINRRVNKVARQADCIEEREIYPHALRATAASRFADAGLNIFALQQMMGWANVSTARNYIASSGNRTARAIRDVSV